MLGDTRVRGSLLVDPAPRGDLLRRGDDDVPVWPARGAAELDALRRFCASAGIDLELVDADPCPESPASVSTDTVVAVGSSLAQAARLYAHLTGRTWAVIDHDAMPPPGATVLVLPAGQLQRPWLERIHERGAAPGLVVALDHSSLRLQLLLRSAALHMPSVVAPRCARVFALDGSAPCTYEPTTDRTVTLANTSAAIESLCSSGADVLTITSHSDGIDAHLGPAVLCPMDRSPHPRGDGPVPRCMVVGRCHRLGTTMAEAIASGKLIAPEQLAARILVLDVCWGAILSPYPFDARWTLWWRLLVSPRIGALVAPVGVVFGSTAESERLERRLQSDAIGHALARFRSDSRDLEGRRYYLFGDPRLRLVESARPSPHVATPSPSAIAEPMSSDPAGFMQAQLRMLPRIAAADDARNDALAGVQRHGSDPDGLPREIRCAVLRAQAQRGPLLAHTWAGSARSLAVTVPMTRCEQCEGPVEHSFFRARGNGRWTRTIARCDGCGIVGDADVDAPSLRLRVHAGTAYLVGEDIGRDWDAVLLLWPRRDAVRRILEWPAASDGRPVTSLILEAPLPYGRIEAALLVVHGLRLQSAGAMFIHASTDRESAS